MMLLLSIVATAWLTTAASAASSKTLCANTVGAFVGLAVDEHVYDNIQGAPPADGSSNIQQQWTLVEEDTSRGQDGPQGPVNSFTGKFLQVLPDDGRNYPARGVHLKDISQLVNESPHVDFKFHVDKNAVGWHTIFLRWTGGDKVGGGDSLYVSLWDQKGKNYIPAARTLKPAVVPIDSTAVKNYAGCCYDRETHACPCHKTQPTSNVTCSYFVSTSQASRFGAKCPVGPGVMDFVEAPQWFLFAGQEMGDVTNFDSEPWDATCEPEGGNTADSGRAFAAWEILKAGTYKLRIFAREDGTALDAVYIAGPKAPVPSSLARYKAGESTVCGGPLAGGNSGGSAIGAFFRVVSYLKLASGGTGPIFCRPLL